MKEVSRIEISEVEILPVKPRGGLVAFASWVINDSLYIGNVALYTSPSKPGGFRLVYPSKTLPNGKEISCVHPINKKAGELISNAIIKKFEEMLSKIRGGEF